MCNSIKGFERRLVPNKRALRFLEKVNRLLVGREINQFVFDKDTRTLHVPMKHENTMRLLLQMAKQGDNKWNTIK